MAVGDLSPSYADHATKVLRGVALREDQTAWIQDEILLESPGEIWWRMHTEASIQFSQNNRVALLELNGKKLQAYLVSPVGAGFISLKAEPLPGTPKPAGQDPNLGVSVLAVNLKQTHAVTVAVWLVPLPADKAPPKTLPTVEPLSTGGWVGLHPGNHPIRKPLLKALIGRTPFLPGDFGSPMKQYGILGNSLAGENNHATMPRLIRASGKNRTALILMP